MGIKGLQKLVLKSVENNFSPDITFKFSIGASPEFASIRLKSDNLCYCSHLCIIIQHHKGSNDTKIWNSATKHQFMLKSITDSLISAHVSVFEWRYLIVGYIMAP